MDLIRINPTKILVGGDVIRARDFIGPAKSQMEILINNMSFQSLTQSVRRIWLYDDVYIECKKCFDYQECRIWVQPKEKDLSRYFLIVFSTESEDEAVVWDLISDSVFLEKSTLTEIETILSDNHLPAIIATEELKTDNYIWDSSAPTQALSNTESHLMLPNYNIGWYHIDYEEYNNELYWSHNFVYPSNRRDWFAGYWPGETEWDLLYIEESPYPYPNKIPYASGVVAEIDEKSSFITTWQIDVNPEFFDPANPDTHSMITTFNTLTNQVFPESNGVWRYVQYWHPLFSYTKDFPVTMYNFSQPYIGIKISDSWENGEWITTDDGPVLDKSTLVENNFGMASRKDDSDDPFESIIFEFVNVCHKFVDTYENGMCDKELSELTQYFRIYEHGKLINSGYPKELFDLTNAYRLSNGKNILVFNSVLCAAAQRHAKDMASLYAQQGNLEINGVEDGHTGTDNSISSERMFDAGYFIGIEDDVQVVIDEEVNWGYIATENTVYSINSNNIVTDAMNALKASYSHNGNMLDENLSELGIGFAMSSYNGDIMSIFVQDFGHMDQRYPGFGPFDTTKLKSYVDESFIFDPVKESSRLPKISLIGTINLTAKEFYRITGNKE